MPVQQILDLQDVLRLLRSEIKRAGSQRRFAREAGVNISVVSRTLSGQVLPSKKFFARLSFAQSICPIDASPRYLRGKDTHVIVPDSAWLMQINVTVEKV